MPSEGGNGPDTGTGAFGTVPVPDAKGQRLVAALFLIALLNYVDRSIISVLQEPIKRDLGLSDTQLGALTGLSFALLYATLAIPIANYADRAHRTRLLAASVALWSIMTGLVNWASGFWSLVVLRLGVALGEAGSGPNRHSLIGDVVSGERRGRALAIMALAVPAGTMLGFLSAGWISTAIGWRDTFLFLGIVGLLSAPFIWRMREPPRVATTESMSTSGLRADTMGAALASLARLTAFRTLLLAATCHAFALYGFQNWSAPFYMRVHGLTTGEVGTALAFMFGIGGGAGALLGGYLVDRLGARDAVWFGRIPAIAGLGALPLLLVQFLASSTSLAICAGSIAIFLMHIFIAPTNAAAQASVPSDMRAITSATLLAVPSIVGVGLAPLLTGAASDMLVSSTGSQESIRYAILLPVCALPFSAWLFVRSGVALRERFRSVGRY